MAGEWETIPVAEAPLEIIDGDRGVNYPKQEDFGPSGDCLFLNTGNVTTTGFNFTDRSFITKEKDAALRKGKLKRHDVVLTTRGTVGNVALFDDSIHFEHVRINSGMVLLRADESKLWPRFLFQFVRSPLFKEQVAALTTGSAQPQLPIRDIRRVEIPLPPLAEQKAIAAVLGARDDKIELNRRMNATLEAMARALFQSWFVDFDPVRAKLDGRIPPVLDPVTGALFPDSFKDSPLSHIPRGWETGSILRQADLLSGGTPKTDIPAYWNGDVPWASAKDVSQFRESFLVSTERTITMQGVNESSTKIIPAFATVVVARGATTGRLTMFGHAMAMNQTCYGLRSKVGAPFALYCNVLHFIERLVQGGHGSIFDTITTSTFEATDVLLAPKEVLLAFDKQVTPLFQQVHANIHQSRTLAALRDTLLPKLLSGELSVASLDAKPETAR